MIFIFLFLFFYLAFFPVVYSYFPPSLSFLLFFAFLFVFIFPIFVLFFSFSFISLLIYFLSLSFLIFFSSHHIVNFFLCSLTPLRISFFLSFPFLHTPLSSSFTSPYLLLFLPLILFRIITQTPIHVVFINTIMIKIN